MKIVSILGARPQFIKASVVSREIRKNKNNEEIIIHTGQHFDAQMSSIFFNQMQIPPPDINLEINSLSHGAMTARMLEGIETALIKIRPDWVLIYGDTNSTLAGALAAVKLQIPVAHVEAGLRSRNLLMPEEINRILADRCSTLLLCPTQQAVTNLREEGFETSSSRIVNCGDVMLDAALYYRRYAKQPDFHLPPRFLLATLHRAENTDDSLRMRSIFSALNELNSKIPIIMPLHPRTRLKLTGAALNPDLRIVAPVGYLEMLYLLEHCRMVITDSGGLQKEAFFFRKPCLTLREETEWKELVDCGCNILAGVEKDRIMKAYRRLSGLTPDFNREFYGNGRAAGTILVELSA